MDAELAREQAERFEMVLEGTRLGMWDWNPQTDEVTFDERWAEMLGHTLDEIPFELDSWSSRVHPDDLEGCFADIQRHIAGEVDFYENVHRMRHADGHWVHVLDRGRIMERDEQGRPTRFTGTHTDITAQREAEFAAQAANRAKSTFLANMSHEIRTPLNGVLGHVQLLRRAGGLTDEQLAHLDAIERSGDHLLGLINDVLAMSRIEAGRSELDPDPFDLGRMVADVVSMVEPRLGSVELRLQAPAPGEAVVLGDAGKLRQVLVNLLGNAVKFTTEGVIEVGAEVLPDGTVLVEVHDDGPGIAEQDAAQVFEPFGQTVAGTQAGGAGLGLSISREFARLHGGDLVLVPGRRRGAGFRMTVRAPRVDAVLDERTAPRRVAGVTTGGPAPRVRVVDDVAGNREVLGGLLRLLGCEVAEENDGGAAVAHVRRNPPDIVLMDYRMPVLDGVSATALLAEDPATAGVPVVVVSASALTEDRERALESGAVGFLAKPVREEHVVAALEQHAGVVFAEAGDGSSGAGVGVSALDVAAVLDAAAAARLRGAAAAGDVRTIHEVVAAAARRDERVGRHLRRLADTYDHAALLELLPT